MAAVNAAEKFLEVNGIRLRYLDWGTSGKTPLVCLHGHTGQAHIWDEFAEAMAPHYHVLALDQRGHGGSQWATDGYDREKFVADLGAFLDALNLNNIVLSGLSMGGWNSLLYSHRNPDRIQKAIIVDIAPESSEESKNQRGIRPPTPLVFETIDEAIQWTREGNPWADGTRLRQDVLDRIRQTEDGRWAWKADPKLFNTRLPDMENQGMIDGYWKAATEIQCPILLVRGTESILVSDQILDRMRHANPLFKSVDVAGAGHVVTVDKPSEFIEATRGFLGVGT